MADRGAHPLDRRVERTQKLLREALHSLIREKDYDTIVVKEILDRANVGRSAFYAHFKDKDALLASSIHELVGIVPAGFAQKGRLGHDELLWFSLPILEYHEQHRRGGMVAIGKRAQAVLHEHLRKVLAELIGQRLRRLRARGRERGAIPQALLAEFLAGTFVLVLDWWIGTRMATNAAEADKMFRALVEPNLG